MFLKTVSLTNCFAIIDLKINDIISFRPAGFLNCRSSAGFVYLQQFIILICIHQKRRRIAHCNLWRYGIYLRQKALKNELQPLFEAMNALERIL